ncbi:MAG: Calx-beta domain-containing protein [Verrucomicrobiia bacterium]
MTVEYATANGTARAGEDYVTSRGTATIPAGASTATISVPILDDALIEPDETFTVTLSNPVNASLAAEQTTGTAVIVDEDVPTLSVDDPAVVEPPIGETAALAFTARLSAVPQRPVAVDFATADGTAKAPLDYTSASGRLEFAPGATQAQVQVEIVGDKSPEPAETFSLNLSNPTGAQLERPQAKGTILDDSTLPELVIEGVSVIEGLARVNTEAVFKLRLSKPGTQVIEVDYSTLNGTASGGSDFVIGAGTVRFAPGETNATIRIVVHGDDYAEFDETFLVRLTNPRRTSIAVAQAQGTIVNDDYLPLLAAAGSQLRLENCFPPNRAIDPLETVTVDFGLVNHGLGSSTNLIASLRATDQVVPLSNPQRYGALVTNGVAVFRPFTFSVNGECGMPFTSELELRDGDRAVGVVSFEFTLGLLAGGEFTCCTSSDLAVGVISEPEPVSLLEPLRYIITITNQGPSMATGVLLTNRFSAPVNLVSAGPTPWQTTFSDNVLVCEIGELFPGETRRVTNIVAPRELPSLMNSVFVGGLERDPVESNNRMVAANTVVPPVGLSIGDLTVSEGNEDHVIEVPVYLWPARSQAVTLGFEFAPGTATPGEDYIATPGSVTFAPGTTAATIPLPIKGDLIDEPDETLTILLRNPVNAPIARGEAVCTIADDDWPALSISSTAVNVGTNTSVNALLTVRLSSAFPEPVQVEYFTSNGTATAGTDYVAQRNTLIFHPGTNALVLRIPLSGNTADERQEEFFVWLTNAVNAALPAGPAVVTITDDAPVDLSISDASATEGDAGQTEAVFTVTLRSPLEQTATVEFYTLDGTARASSDYLPVQGTLRFPPGTLQQQIAVPIVGDLISEPVENFFLALTNAVNGVIRVPRGTGTIIDNDPVPCFSIADLVVPEGDSGTNNVSMTLRLSAPSSEMVRVEAVWSNCGTSVPGQQGLPEQVVFAPGQTQASLRVPVIGDRIDEPDTVCMVNLTNAVGAAICDGEAQLVIQDDDPAPGLEITDAQVIEGNTGATEAVFTVTLAGLSAQTVTVRFNTADGTATTPSDYVASSGTLTFPPGLASATVRVKVNGDEAVEPDETFQVVLSQPVNATLFKATGTGTIRNDDTTPQTDCPSLVVVATPGDQLCFEPFTPITLIAVPDEGAERLTRMEFYSGSTLLGIDTSSPFEITWEGVPAGDYCVTAEAVCPNGSRVRSEPLCLGVTDRGAPVAIVRNFDDPEIDHLRQYLLEMGYCARVFDQQALNFDELTSYWLVIWDDLGAPGLTSSTVRILRQLFDYGIPIYLIGDRLASAANSFDADARADWAYLLHMNPLSRSGSPGTIEFSKATENRQPGSILAGRFAEVADFAYTNTVDFGTVEVDAATIATGSEADLLVHYPTLDVTDFGQPRSVSQSFRVTTGGDDTLAARKALFQNAVCWLLRCWFCPLVYLSVEFSEVPAVVNTGAEFSFDITVGNNGECIAFATTITNHLPAGLSFVNAEFNKGSGVYYNPQDRTLIWRVGSLSSGTENNGILTVTVRAVQPGTFQNSACAVANYELLNESNCAEVDLRIQGEALPEPPELSMIRTGAHTLQLRLSGQDGGKYQIQTSSDLSNWLQWTNASGPVFYIELPDANFPGNSSRFYRAR